MIQLKYGVGVGGKSHIGNNLLSLYDGNEFSCSGLCMHIRGENCSCKRIVQPYGSRVARSVLQICAKVFLSVSDYIFHLIFLSRRIEKHTQNYGQKHQQKSVA